MRTARTKRFRIYLGASLIILLAAAPMLLGFAHPAGRADVPGLFGVYAHGLTSLGAAGMVALPLAVIFALWLMAGERRAVNRKYLARGARSRVNFFQSLRTLSIVGGASGLIVGSLAGLYATIVVIQPDVAFELPLPFFTFQLAGACLLVGGLLYALGRTGR